MKWRREDFTATEVVNIKTYVNDEHDVHIFGRPVGTSQTRWEVWHDGKKAHVCDLLTTAKKWAEDNIEKKEA